MKKKSRRKFYRRKDCIKRFCNDLKELVTEIINYKEEEMTTLTSDEVTLYESQKVCHICKGAFCYDANKKSEFKLYIKLEIIVIAPENLERLLIMLAI